MAGDSSDNQTDGQLKVLVQKRGQVKAKLTRFKTFIDTLTPDSNITQLKLRLAKLENVLAEFEEVQSEIETIDCTDSAEERDSFEALFYDLAAQGEDFISKNAPKTQQPTTSNTGNSSNTPTTSSQVQVRLPSIDLPSFNGHYENWLSFSDTFQALIHTNESLNDVQKFHYLRSALKGEATQVIQSLELTSSNYSVAWTLLEERFRNKKIIIQKHVNALFNLPHVDKDPGHSLRRLLDGALKHIRALKALEQPTDSWDTLLLHLVTSKLNPSLQREWELSTAPNNLPTFNELTQFLQRRCQVLDNSSSSKLPQSSTNSGHKPKLAQNTCLVLHKHNCRLCNGNHAVFQCQDLLKLSQSERYQRLKEAGLCFNCLQPGHKVPECRSRGCRICSLKHNTALHMAESRPSSRMPSKESEADKHSKKEGTVVVTGHTASPGQGATQVLLSTAIVDIFGPSGKTVRCRALLDSGSQSCFMTENIVQQLGLHKSSNSCQVLGINEASINMTGTTSATIKSCVTNYKVALPFLTVSKITGNLPTEKVDVEEIRIPKHIVLADPNFGSPGRIDILIGQEIFWDLLCIGQHKSKGLPTLQKTRLGWIVGGKVEKNTQQSNNSIACYLTTTEKISSQLQSFWTIEEPVATKVHLTSEEVNCEEHFMKHTTREEDGRYTVKMPFRCKPSHLGDSKEMATRRFMQIEKKLARDPEIKKQYSDFMKEYEDLNHMKKIDEEQETLSEPEYFLPHHPVLKTSSTTTKLRVVFDASAKSTSGKSLNDIQMVGPTVQSDLFSILVRFRMHTFVMTADLEKMYRQVNINSSQRNLLKIIWRETPLQPLQTYRLNTVTYGTASASYLATRTLLQLAEDEQLRYSNAAIVTKRDFYVDDLMTGTDTEEEGIELQNQLIEMLAKGGFNIRKWNSNSDRLLKHLNPALCERQQQEFPKDGEAAVKTLGLWWDAKHDQFHFKHSPVEQKRPEHLSKRILLSEIAKLFDPLGLVAPVIVRAKMQMQELWKLQISWDETLPMHLHTQWRQFLSCLSDLNEIIIPRQATLPTSAGAYELHGFSDASERAYGGAVYLRHIDNEGNIKSTLICSKSRVAPLKTISLPRMELCAALLLVELVAHVKPALPFEPQRITYWTDSTVVLAWINAEPARWTTFVANRVSKIHDHSTADNWTHVRTEENPADLISRGTRAQNLANASLWWNGPSWLSLSDDHWPGKEMQQYEDEDLPERRSSRVNTFCLTKDTRKNDTIVRLIERFSSFRKIIRVLALCFRFTNNLKSSTEHRQTEPLTVEDLQRAKHFLLRSVQQEAFHQEIRQLTKPDGTATFKGQLASLALFAGEDGLIRVGGRLERSGLPYDGKHQILLPKSHRITEMIAIEEHLRQLHCGPQALLYAIRQQYWPINGRNLTRKITRQCLVCFRAKPKHAEQQMGTLPASRVNPVRTFLHTGVDYCGPFAIKQSKRRGSSAVKCYVAVFVCLATKALHLELVSNLTTEAFLASLRRFTSRRGICAEIMSDNGKNFVGARRELKELQDFLRAESSKIVRATAEEGIRWRFIPPYSPHMGGLWEAAVRSLKHHLRRIVGTAALTFEELATLLTQVEAVLNSRPLSPMSNDPSDLSVLTPAHFLTGGSLKAVPEPSLLQLPERRLSRWQRVQQLQQHFWARWSKEYLSNLQQRGKWKTPLPALQVGTLVLLKDDHTPPLSWPMGRVTHLHPGKDDLVRVVTVRTAAGEVKRNIIKLCPLPVED